MLKNKISGTSTFVLNCRLSERIWGVFSHSVRKETSNLLEPSPAWDGMTTHIFFSLSISFYLASITPSTRAPPAALKKIIPTTHKRPAWNIWELRPGHLQHWFGHCGPNQRDSNTSPGRILLGLSANTLFGGVWCVQPALCESRCKINCILSSPRCATCSRRDYPPSPWVEFLRNGCGRITWCLFFYCSFFARSSAGVESHRIDVELIVSALKVFWCIDSNGISSSCCSSCDHPQRDHPRRNILLLPEEWGVWFAWA